MAESVSILAYLASAESEAAGLNAGGLFMMILSIALVTALSAFCLYRIFRESTPSTHHHAPLEIDTDDENHQSR